MVKYGLKNRNMVISSLRTFELTFNDLVLQIKVVFFILVMQKTMNKKQKLIDKKTSAYIELDNDPLNEKKLPWLI